MKSYVFLFLICISLSQVQAQSAYKSINTNQLPYGNTFSSWENSKTIVRKIYYVDGRTGSDNNPGTEKEPFKTISKAASILEPGEKVIIQSGTYREQIRPAKGGTDAQHLISYEAAPNAKVIVKGSQELDPKLWELGKYWIYDHSGSTHNEKVYVYSLDGNMFAGYNPFGMANVQHDRTWLQYQKVKMKSHFARRGMVFVDGKPLTQVEKPTELSSHSEGAFWTEHNGLTLHVHFPQSKNPKEFTTEITTAEQIFAPREYYLGYIHLKGIHFLHAGNGFPVPQRGMVSANRGHHWLIENCTFEWANALGLSLGTEMWHNQTAPVYGNHIVRKNMFLHCGISGLSAGDAHHYLIEDNLFEDIGWQDAEHGFEAAAVKLHGAQHTLIRRNVFKDIQHASGLWLDYLSNQNVRVTQNVFSNIITARGGVYVEASHSHCFIDHNVFHKTFSQYWISGDYGAGGNGFYTDGSDSIYFFNNLCLDIENTGYGAYLNADRIVNSRGGITRDHFIHHNLFIQCKKYAIELPNVYHRSENNLFSDLAPGYLKMRYPEPALYLDLQGWRRLFQFDLKSKWISKKEISMELDGKTLMFQSKGLIDNNMGPFEKYTQSLSIDPRKF